MPEDYATIQAAVDAAEDGQIVLIAEGVYHEDVRITGKSVVLASEFLRDGNPRHVRQTVLDGSIHPDPDPDDDIDAVRPYVILIEADAGPETAVVGLTIRDGDDGVSCYAPAKIHFNHFVNNTDAIDYEGGGGVCSYNTFVANDDDAIDLDLDCAALIEHNTLRDNDDDGIEIRLHDYTGPTLRVVIRRNAITGNGEDGIQIIDYPGLSDRQITISRNIIACSSMSGIGCMSDGVTLEDYRAADIPEPIRVTENHFRENHYGITGGDNMEVVGNLFADHAAAGLKAVDGRSRVASNLYWNNGAETKPADLPQEDALRGEPMIDADPGSRVFSPVLLERLRSKGEPAGSVSGESGETVGPLPEIIADGYRRVINLGQPVMKLRGEPNDD